MIDLDLQTGLYLLAAAVVGVIIGWLIRSWSSSRSLKQLSDQWQHRFEQAVHRKDQLSAENLSAKSSLESQQLVVMKHAQAAVELQTETKSLREKENALSRNLSAVGAERDELKDKLSRIMALVSAGRQHMAEQKAEITRISDFYKVQLKSAFEQRTALEGKNDHDKSENESLRNLLMSTKAEHESVSNLLASAQSRLETLDAMEQKVISLGVENSELRQATTLAKREVEALQRDVTEMDALKVQNRELAQFLESMESSRKQYESDADRYRSQYEKSEKESETLRFKLSDIEKNGVEMQRREKEARNADPTLNAVPPPLGLDAPQGEPDDLKEIVGVGKVFEATLHSLGVYHFRQIAAFGPTEIARINAELNEFKGRIEHDDWIGQARELHLRKYEDADE